MIVKILILYFLFFCVVPIFSIETWMYVYHPTLKEDYIQNNIKKYKYICITGFRFNAKGKLQISIPLNQLFSMVWKQNVYPLVSLKNTKHGKILLRNKKYRQNAINNIISLIQKYDFKGVHIDFEYLTSYETPFFALFLKEIRLELKKNSKKLTVAIFPPIWDSPYKDFHDPEIIAPYVDEVVVMTYDYHNPKTAPGPISEIKWIKQNIQELLKFFDRNQIWLGIPLYGYEWTIRSKQYGIVDYPYYRKILSSPIKKKVMSSSDFGTQIVYINRNHQTKIIFYPDREFRKKAKEIAKMYRLKGVAYWRLGFEKYKY